MVDRVIGQTADAHPGKRKGVSVTDVLGALQHPVSIGDVVTRGNGQRSIKYIGVRCEVVLNPDLNIVIQTNPRKR